MPPKVVCVVCAGPLGERSVAGVCLPCCQPESVAHRLQNMPGPLGDTMRRVATDMGIIERQDYP